MSEKHPKEMTTSELLDQLAKISPDEQRWDQLFVELEKRPPFDWIDQDRKNRDAAEKQIWTAIEKLEKQIKELEKRLERFAQHEHSPRTGRPLVPP